MFAETLFTDRYDSIAYRHSAAENGSTARAKTHRENVPRAAGAQPAGIDDLMVVLSASEPHRDVAARAQRLARDSAVSRTVLFTPRLTTWAAFAQRVSTVGTRLSAFGADVSARILRASVPADRVRVETDVPAADAVRPQGGASLVVIGRRRAFPWALFPLARYARRLLRCSRAPMLVVGSRPTGPYRNVVIASDLTTDAGPALKWARRVAPNASFTFLHAYRGLFERKLQWASVPLNDILAHRLAARRGASQDMAALLERHRSEEVQRAALVHGSPVHDVLRKARELEADLIVVVRSTHSWWAEVLGASVSTEIAARADRDVLIVHA